MERHVTKMVVLGEGFQVGDMYDYRTDRVVTGMSCIHFEYYVRNFQRIKKYVYNRSAVLGIRRNVAGSSKRQSIQAEIKTPQV